MRHENFPTPLPDLPDVPKTSNDSHLLENEKPVPEYPHEFNINLSSITDSFEKYVNENKTSTDPEVTSKVDEYKKMIEELFKSNKD